MSWSSLIPAIAQIGATAYGAYSANRAAGQQASAIRDASAQTAQSNQQALEFYQPWRDAGQSALATLTPQLTQDFQTSPGYQFRLNEGLRGVQSSAAARGMLNSGSTLKALERYGQDYASNEYNNYINRLLALSGLGQTAAGGSAQTALSGGSQLANLGVMGGTAQAQGTTGTANALLGGANSLLSLYALGGLGK